MTITGPSHTPLPQLLADLPATVDQLPKKAYTREAQSLSETLKTATGRRRGPALLGELLVVQSTKG